MQSISTLTNSDAGLLIDGFFSVAIIEEVALTELSAFEIEAGCYPSTPTVYCIGDVSRARIRNAFDYDVAAFISSLSGRGVAQGDINIQQLSNRTDEVVMHELGHSHGYMGDEYDSGSEYGEDLPRADTYINTTSVTDPDIVKWKHFIDDINNVPGFDYDICYNYSDGDIYYRDQVGNGTYRDCECFGISGKILILMGLINLALVIIQQLLILIIWELIQITHVKSKLALFQAYYSETTFFQAFILDRHGIWFLYGVWKN